MKSNTSSSTTIINFIIIIYSTIHLFSPITSQPVCRKTCGKLPVKYPFGTGFGCGDPRFQQYITCNTNTNNDGDGDGDQLLTLTTHTGRYTITDIDYTNQILYITDPTMSTCACTRPSKGFGLDSNAPFSFPDDMVFTLLDCSTTSSPIFRPNNTVSLCDEQGGGPICNFLYSCKSISSSSMMKLPLSACCVYTPVDLGPVYDMDLEKLGCGSYSGFYGFSGEEESGREDWKYGIAVKYRFNVYDEFPSFCGDCERSNGVCGYGGNDDDDDGFVCNCPSGLNTTTNCFFMASYNHGLRSLPWRNSGTWLYFSAWIVVWMLLKNCEL